MECSHGRFFEPTLPGIVQYMAQKSVGEELEELLKMRRPSPLIWHEALSWLRSEAKLPKEQAERLDRAITPLARPDLDQEALNGR